MNSFHFGFRSSPCRALILVTLAALAGAAQAQTISAFATDSGQNQIVTFKDTSSFNNFVSGIEINGFIGAKTFYNAGYTGTRSTVANVEGGIASSNHEMTSKILQTFYGVGALNTAAAIQDHATACTSMIAGYDAARPYDGLAGQTHTSYSTGIAYGANLWTGNLATAIGAGGSFSTSTNSTFTAYYNALIGGIGGKTANIASSSWGSTSTNLTTQRSFAAGLTFDAISIDAIVSHSNKLIAVAAGNNGTVGNGTTQAILRAPGSPAGGNNALVVGASGPNNFNTPGSAYNSRASFSAYGPSSAFVAITGQSGNVINEATAQRARVDILAPGVGIVGAASGGPGNYLGGDGTSFATPIVSGGAALVEDVAKSRGFLNAMDNRVVIAILQNSATKLTGWTNNSSVVGGVQKTTQALDFQQGAGEMNLDKAYGQLTVGTHDVAGTGGGKVAAQGWDLGALSLGGSNDYTMNLTGGTTFTSTLRFNSGADYGALGADNSVNQANLQFQYLSNFSLQLYSGIGATATLLAESNAAYITSEHFMFNLATSGLYTLRVNYLSDVYNLTGHGAIGYGLAWSGTGSAVPEPATWAVLGLGVAALARRRRKA